LESKCPLFWRLDEISISSWFSNSLRWVNRGMLIDLDDVTKQA
jgi:hypothetical protein